MNSADAVMDVIAPPARTAPTRAPAAASADEPSFEDHLEVTKLEDAPAEAAPASSPEQTPSCETDSETLLGEPESAPIAAPTPLPEQAAAPVIVQLIAIAPSQAPPAPTQTAASAPNDVAPTAPASTPAAPALAKEAASPMETAPSADKSGTPAPAETAQQTAAPPPPKSAPLDNNAQQQTSAPVTTQQAAAPTVPAIAPTANSAAPPPPIEGAAIAAAVVAPTQAQTPDATRHARSTPARGDTKIEAPEAQQLDKAAAQPVAAPRANPKAAALQSAGKDASIVQPLDAPDAAQPQTPTTTAAGPAQAASAHHAGADQIAARAAPMAHQVAREIVRRFEGGNTRFELRLDPPELGRVEVRLEVSRDHRVTAVIAADNPQALTELVRHARELEQMLQGAGLELGDNGLSFDLRQHSANETAEFGQASFNEKPASEEAAPAARPLGYERWRGVRVDMMV